MAPQGPYPMFRLRMTLDWKVLMNDRSPPEIQEFLQKAHLSNGSLGRARELHRFGILFVRLDLYKSMNCGRMPTLSGVQ